MKRFKEQRQIERQRLVESQKGIGGCFIATAAYGTSLAPELEVLRIFRDDFMHLTDLGKLSIRLYYKMSPPIANTLWKSESLRWLFRKIIDLIVRVVKFSNIGLRMPAHT